MKLIVGLGNPGNKYKNTRHNVGFMVLDKLAGKLQASTPKNGQASYKLQDDWKESKKGKLMYWWFEVEGERVELIKPVTFMNRSGEAMAYVKKKHPELDLNDLYMVHDDLDIELGKYKIQFGKGPRIHNGLNSVYEKLGSKNFWHVRLGIAGKQFQEVKSQESKVKDFGKIYVLQRFSDEERKALNKVVGEVVYRLCREFE